MDLETRDYVDSIKAKYPANDVISTIDKFNDLKVCAIGDAIIDRYTYVEPHGRATKDAILSTRRIDSEDYAGGIIAIANHLAGFVNSVDLITLLGDNNRYEEFLRSKINSNVDPKFFTKPNSPTIIKERFLNSVRNEKLFKMDYMNDHPIPRNVEDEISKYFESNLSKYDLVVVGDFGHGFITNNLVNTIESHSPFLAANVQTNSANNGFNLITRYKSVQFLTSNEGEIRFALQDRFADLDSMICGLRKNTNFKNFLLTLGKRGILYSHDGENYTSPALTSSVKDVVGAGDAVFAFSSLCDYSKMNPNLLTFLANAVGGIAVNIVGNKESVSKESLLTFISDLYKGV